MNDEPVAELVLEQMAVGDASSLRVKWLTDSYPPVGTLLYTNPTELTDEEIWKTIIEGGFYDCVVDWLSMPCEEDRANLKRDLIRLAKAILRKAQEK